MILLYGAHHCVEARTRRGWQAFGTRDSTELTSSHHVVYPGVSRRVTVNDVKLCPITSDSDSETLHKQCPIGDSIAQVN